MKTLLREPLFYFLLLGGTFFLLYQLLAQDAGGGGAGREQITVSDARVQALAARFEKTWRRAPTEAELAGLVENYVRAEVYYREALALGLDRDDAVVRRRLQQKLEFMTEDLVVPDEPEEGELQAYFAANADAYRRPPRFSFIQVYLNPDRRGAGLRADARELLAGLRDGSVDPAAAGDTSMLQLRFENETDRNIERVLGQRFRQQLSELPVGSWQGPVISAFGPHLVLVEERIDGELPALDEVRNAVLRDWSAEKRREANAAVYEELRSRYQVVIDEPLSDAGTGMPGGWGRA